MNRCVRRSSPCTSCVDARATIRLPVPAVGERSLEVLGGQARGGQRRTSVLLRSERPRRPAGCGRRRTGSRRPVGTTGRPSGGSAARRWPSGGRKRPARRCCAPRWWRGSGGGPVDGGAACPHARGSGGAGVRRAADRLPAVGGLAWPGTIATPLRRTDRRRPRAAGRRARRGRRCRPGCAGAAGAAPAALAEQVELLLLRLAADTGARCGELAALRAHDLTGRVLTLEHGVSEEVLTTTETGRSRRVTLGATGVALWHECREGWQHRLPAGQHLGPWLFSADLHHAERRSLSGCHAAPR